ncbi:Uncharacterised protein [uncultured archaeon]|nr:Uncharacterised protein [uncultured archaeon]
MIGKSAIITLLVFVSFVSLASAGYDYANSAYWHCDIGGPWGWKTTDIQNCPSGYVNFYDSSQGCSSSFGDVCLKYTTFGNNGCSVSNPDECCYQRCRRYVADSCTDSSWGPSTSSTCLGVQFTQTSNCGNTRTAVGTLAQSAGTWSGTSYGSWSICNSSGQQSRVLAQTCTLGTCGGNCVQTSGWVQNGNSQTKTELNLSCGINQVNNQTNQTNITIIINNTNVTINLNQTVINVYNITNYIYLNISGNINIYNFNYSINGLGNNTVIQNITLNITNIYNLTIYIINNTYIFYNTTIIYGNQTSNSTNTTNNTLVIPYVHIIYPYNGTIYSNSTALNVSANWGNNTGNILYSLDGINYYLFSQNMLINFSYGWNNLTLAVSNNGVNYLFTDLVRFNLVNGTSNNSSNSSTNQSSISSRGCAGKAYSDNQTISLNNFSSNNKVVNLSWSKEEIASDSTKLDSMVWVNIILFLAIIILFFVIIYLMI